MSRSASGTVESSGPGLDRVAGRGPDLPCASKSPAIWFFHPRFWEDRRSGQAERHMQVILSAAASEGWAVYWIGPGSGRILWDAEPESCVRQDRPTGIVRVRLGGRWVYPWLSRVMWRKLRNGPVAMHAVSLVSWMVDSGWRVPDFRIASHVLPLVSCPVRSLSVLPERGPVVSLSGDASEGLLRLGLPQERLVRLHRSSKADAPADADSAAHGARMFCALLDVIRAGDKVACPTGPAGEH